MFRPRSRTDVDTVDAPPLDETDLLMIERRRRRVVTPLTRFLAVLVIAALGVVAGAMIQKSRGSSAATGAPSGLPAGLPGGGAGGLPDFAALAGAGGGATPSLAGGANPFGAAGGATIGTVKLVDGANVYVQDAAGNVTKVSTGPDATITVSKSGVITDLQVGQTITVQGDKDTDGTVAATSITGGSTAPSTGAG